ncbi:hypothetical protein KXD40_007529 [Peronospora effusa]|nr:hypothetical protein KXD40_007529 [Peronospora effusa]
MGLPTPTMKIGSEAVSQTASGGESKKELDTPGIEPGAFRLQSGRAQLRYAPSNYISNCRNTKTLSRPHNHLYTHPNIVHAWLQVIIVDFYAPIHSKRRFFIADTLPGNDSQNRRPASVATHSHAGGRGSKGIMGLPTPTMKIVFKDSEAVSQAASGGESKKELDTPGIEPGAFRLQSGRAQLRYAPNNYISNCRNTKTLSRPHTHLYTHPNIVHAWLQVIIVYFYAPIHSKRRFIIANPLPGNDSQNRRPASVATHSHAGGRGS